MARNQPDGLSAGEKDAYDESDSNQAIFFVHKAGSTGVINATSTMATIGTKSAVLVFRKQLVYKVNPGGNSLASNALECVYLTFRANSIYQIFQQTGSVNHTGVWTSQNALEYSPGVNCNADGYDNWKTRFQHFTVL